MADFDLELFINFKFPASIFFIIDLFYEPSLFKLGNAFE